MSRTWGQMIHESGFAIPEDSLRHQLVLDALASRLRLSPDLPDREDFEMHGRLSSERLIPALKLSLERVAAKGFGSALFLIDVNDKAHYTIEFCLPERNLIHVVVKNRDSSALEELLHDIGEQLRSLGIDVYMGFSARSIRCEWLSEEQEAALSVGDIESVYLAVLAGVPIEDLMA